MQDDASSIALFGITISRVTFDGLCARVSEWIAAGAPGFVVTPNVQHVCLCHRNDAFRDTYRAARLALPDGVPIMWAARLFGHPLPQKLSGSDMVPRISAYAAERGHSVYFLGGAPGSAERTAEILCARHPALRVAGIDCPDFGFELHRESNRAVIERVRAAAPDICFIALGSPKQELWMHKHFEELGVPVCFGVGAAFDMMSGRIRRAPHWVQNVGLEWLWRLVQEPRRLWRRYLVEDLVFFKLLWREFRRQRARRARAEAE